MLVCVCRLLSAVNELLDVVCLVCCGCLLLVLVCCVLTAGGWLSCRECYLLLVVVRCAMSIARFVPCVVCSFVIWSVMLVV